MACRPMATRRSASSSARGMASRTGRPQGQGGPRRGGGGGTGAGHGHGGRPFGQPGRPQHGKPRHTDARGGHAPSPYVMTTLTVPGAVPEGLPGTDVPRPKGPGAGGGPRGPGRGHGPNGQGRGNASRRAGGGPRQEARPRQSEPQRSEARGHARQRSAARDGAGDHRRRHRQPVAPRRERAPRRGAIPDQAAGRPVSRGRGRAAAARRA